MVLHLRSLICLLTLTAATSGLGAPQTRSDVAGFVLAPLAVLPRSPANGSLAEFCDHYRIKPKTEAGRLVAGRGWIVTSKARLGSYQAVSFAGSFEPGTSGVCFAKDGNIAIFDGASLVALAYASRSAKSSLGTLLPIEGGLLIASGDGPGAPVGELHETGGTLLLTAVAAAQSVCAGQLVVPNVYGLGISTARKRLIAKGWMPLRPDEAPPEGDLALDLAKRGIVEAGGCAPTGYGYCTFSYRKGAGSLAVTTMGDEPTVISYETSCH